ncbi:MAG: hypothetical protein ACOH2T_18965 [Pseudomonas sp.]
MTVKHYYTMVLTEVIYRDAEGEVHSRRIQQLNKSPTSMYPSTRLVQIQNAAAHQAWQTSGIEDIKQFITLDVFLVATHELGYMTDAEFNDIGAEEVQEAPAAKAQLKIVPTKKKQ